MFFKYITSYNCKTKPQYNNPILEGIVDNAVDYLYSNACVLARKLGMFEVILMILPIEKIALKRSM